MKTWIICCLMFLLSFSLWGCQTNQDVIINFDVNGGEALDDLIVSLPVKNLILPTPTKEGFIFEGWYLDQLFSTVFIDTIIDDEMNSLTLYAKWTEIILEVTLSFMVYGGTSIDPVTYEVGSLIDAPEPPIKEGYTFLGWYTDEALTTLFAFDVMPDHDLTLHAKWVTNTYTIHFISDGIMLVEHELSFDDPIESPQEPTKEGFTFMGWYLDQFFTTLFIFDTMPSHDVTLYAKWTINTYSLQFDTQSENSLDTILIDYDDDIPSLPMPSKGGFTFEGWYLDISYSQSMNIIKMPSHNVTLYAKWTINSYTITFNTNGGSVIETIIDDYQSLFDIPITEKTGYTFEGWYIDIEMLNPYDVEVYTIPPYDLTLYAKWSINSYTITYYSVDHDETMSLPLFPDEVMTYVALGDAYSAAITSFGRLFMWGDNTYGKLGCSDFVNRSYPTDITSFFELAEGELIASVHLGWSHTAAITSFGRVFTWGYNRRDQLGSGNFFDVVNIPEEITDNFNLLPNEVIVDISLGAMHSGAISSLGRIFTWGYNYYGQLGNGTNTGRMFPDDITSYFNLSEGETIMHLSLGSDHSSTVTTNGRLFTWGRNYYGGVGDGTMTDRLLPTDITARLNLEEGEKVIFSDLSSYHNAAITSNHRVFFWTENSLTPYDLTDDIILDSGENIINVSLGLYDTYLFTSNARVLFFQIYTRELIDLTPNVGLATEESIIKFSAGSNHQSLITSLGNLYLWGTNGSGEIGNGSTLNQTDPLFLKPYGLTYMHELLIEYGSSISFYQPTLDEYSLNGWYDDVTLTTLSLQSTMPDHDILLFGSWIENP